MMSLSNEASQKSYLEKVNVVCIVTSPTRAVQILAHFLKSNQQTAVSNQQLALQSAFLPRFTSSIRYSVLHQRSPA